LEPAAAGPQDALLRRVVHNTHRVTIEMVPDRAMERRQARP
jgi:hypothetical protein